MARELFSHPWVLRFAAFGRAAIEEWLLEGAKKWLGE